MPPVKTCPGEFLLEHLGDWQMGPFLLLSKGRKKKKKENKKRNEVRGSRPKANMPRPSHDHPKRVRMHADSPLGDTVLAGTGFSTGRAWQPGAVAPSPCLLVLAGDRCYLPPSTWAAVGFRHQMAGLVTPSSIKCVFLRWCISQG